MRHWIKWESNKREGLIVIQTTYKDFFKAFNYSEKDVLYLRRFHDKDKSNKPCNMSCELGQIDSLVASMKKYNNDGYGIFFIVNGGGHDDKSVKTARAQFIDIDDYSFEEQWERVNSFSLTPSIIIKTKKSLHCYWLLDNGNINLFEDIQKRLIQYFGSDPTIKNKSRVMRLYGFLHQKSEPVMVELVKFEPSIRYTQQQLIDVLPEMKTHKQIVNRPDTHSQIIHDSFPQGQRTKELIRLMGVLQSRGFNDEMIMSNIRAVNQQSCIPPLTDIELEREVFPALMRWQKGNISAESNIEEVKGLLDYKIEYDNEGNVKRKKVVQSIKNHEIVLSNDFRFCGKIKYNEFSQQLFLVGSMPWEYENNCRPWGNQDDSALFSIIQSEYGLQNRNDFYDAIKNISRKSKFNPVRDILETLEYKGNGYIRKLLPDYLGTENSDYNYEVMKLFMLGAINRVYRPGCKFDYAMILQGQQGIGKSTFLQLLALDDSWFNDSLDSLDSDKAAQSLMGSWIIELAELKSLARTAGGVDSVKRFLSATQDKYRIPYERRSDIFPRQCVFAGTTNRADFLQDETGNRRFLIVQVGEVEVKEDLFSEIALQDIRNAWAEAVHILKTENPRLVLPDYCIEEAKNLQEECMVDDAKKGLIAEYLSGKSRTCVIEIWEKALHENGRPAKWQSSEIVNIVLSIDGWKRMKSNGRFGDYGLQKGFEKHDGFMKLPENYEIPFD